MVIHCEILKICMFLSKLDPLPLTKTDTGYVSVAVCQFFINKFLIFLSKTFVTLFKFGQIYAFKNNYKLTEIFKGHKNKKFDIFKLKFVHYFGKI